MAIWIWIVLAWVISKIALGKRKIALPHYIWMLLPEDMYGLTIAGVTIKPYMFFCLYLLFRLIRQKKTKYKVDANWTIASGVFLLCMLLVNLFNNDSLSSVKTVCLAIVVWLCANIYMASYDERTILDVPEIIIAAGIGYGMVFVFGFLMICSGISVPGIVAANRFQSGFFLRFSTMFSNSKLDLIRLRTFVIDPNEVVGAFAYCSTVCILRIVKAQATFREWLCLILSAFCVLLTNSRMALICFILTSIISTLASYKIATSSGKNKMKMKVIFYVLAVLPILPILFLTNVPKRIFQTISNAFVSHSGVNEAYGRFTIWKNAFSVFLDKNPLFGIGMGEMKNYTIVKRDCHNTWLEFICANGLVIGILFLICILFNMWYFWKAILNNSDHQKDDFLWGMFVGTITIMISLVSVSHVACGYLWFGMAALSFATRIHRKNVKDCLYD